MHRSPGLCCDTCPRYRPCRNEGQIVKTLRLSPGQNNSYFMSLSVKNQGQQARFDLPLSSAELRVVRSIIDVSLSKICTLS